jgi:hypothetical protein
MYVPVIRPVLTGNPDPKHISTSFAERNNLNVRMHSRRMTRLTNAFSKKLENHKHAMAPHFLYYNFVRMHHLIKMSPAMRAALGLGGNNATSFGSFGVPFRKPYSGPILGYCLASDVR